VGLIVPICRDTKLLVGWLEKACTSFWLLRHTLIQKRGKNIQDLEASVYSNQCLEDGGNVLHTGHEQAQAIH
jgi:hypothetical protein